MTKQEKIKKCEEFFNNLCIELVDTYERLSSCNKDISAYLCPNGTTDEVTYNSKPELSFRISDHWNWYANIRKCSDPKYIQCYCVDLPRARKRLEEGKASKPIKATCVAMVIDGRYYTVYGEYFDKKFKKWRWMETSLSEVLSYLKVRQFCNN